MQFTVNQNNKRFEWINGYKTSRDQFLAMFEILLSRTATNAIGEYYEVCTCPGDGILDTLPGNIRMKYNKDWHVDVYPWYWWDLDGCIWCIYKEWMLFIQNCCPLLLWGRRLWQKVRVLFPGGCHQSKIQVSHILDETMTCGWACLSLEMQNCQRYFSGCFWAWKTAPIWIQKTGTLSLNLLHI